MKPDKTIYINTLVTLAATLLCYIISLALFSYKIVPTSIVYLF
jgi:hypothetical protein